jgi:hypothetical protein
MRTWTCHRSRRAGRTAAIREEKLARWEEPSRACPRSTSAACLRDANPAVSRLRGLFVRFAVLADVFRSPELRRGGRLKSGRRLDSSPSDFGQPENGVQVRATS